MTLNSSKGGKLIHRAENCPLPTEASNEFLCRCGRKWVHVPAFDAWRLVVFNMGAQQGTVDENDA